MNFLTCTELVENECVNAQLISSTELQSSGSIVHIMPSLVLMIVAAFIIKKIRQSI